MKDYIYKIVQPFKEKKELIFAKPYLDIDWFEELVTNLPNDLLFNDFEQIRHENISDVGMLFELIEFVDIHIPEIPEFPVKLNFSLINEGVVTLDSMLNEGVSDGYKPFFFEFSGYARSWSELKKLMFWWNGTEKISYVKCYLDFSEESNYDQDTNVIAVIKGSVLFSASPIRQKGGKLVIIDSPEEPSEKCQYLLNDSVYDCKTLSIKKKDKSILNETINSLKLEFIPRNVMIYNVGQGNNISIQLEKKKNIFFDIGLTKSRIEQEQAEVKEAIKEYSKVRPELIVLSHWDIDHILGIAYADSTIYNAVWIVPDLIGLKGMVSDSAKRLLKYLDVVNSEKLLIIDESWHNDCIYASNNKKLCIWSGIRKDQAGINVAKKCYKITKANNFGLSITLENKKRILLPGDCEYSILPRDIWNKDYEYVVASHHCSKMSKIPLKKRESNKKAILSYGVANTFGHPDRQQIKELTDLGYQIVTTLGRRHIQCNLV